MILHLLHMGSLCVVDFVVRITSMFIVVLLLFFIFTTLTTHKFKSILREAFFGCKQEFFIFHI